MRHRKVGKTLDRKAAPRLALIKALANSLILYESIKTTEAKAKVTRTYVERLVTLAKKPTLANRRLALKRLPTVGAVRKLFEVIAPRYDKRPGGYTRIVKLSRRAGDQAAMAQISFV
ncbi:MAG: 50S ribosomal protein L17 [Candidatus Kerfeldbacteria bacterium]|nr:50S ribosomal protein L17 [Candidatus Kerfeldbacteria bacterium]